jgi:exoribonuclease-2
VQRHRAHRAHLLAPLRRHPVGARLPLPAFPATSISRAAPAFPGSPIPAARACRAPTCAAFSIDDAATTEIDDAFSVQTLPGIGWRVGIHIAAPGLGIVPGSPLDAIARDRLSTVYMPGNKITMLPDAVVERFTLAAGRDCPAVSLYLTVTPELEITAHESRSRSCRSSPTCAITTIEPCSTPRPWSAKGRRLPLPRRAALLWHLANACEGRRGKPSAMQGNNDYNFAIEGDHRRPGELPRRDQRAQARQPARQAGRRADDRRQQHLGRPARREGHGRHLPRADRRQGAHDHLAAAARGLGVAQYAWSSSPLRRYATWSTSGS